MKFPLCFAYVLLFFGAKAADVQGATNNVELNTPLHIGKSIDGMADNGVWSRFVRVVVPSLHRLTDVSRVFHTRVIRASAPSLEVNPLKYFMKVAKVEIVLHWNDTAPLGKSPRYIKWQAVDRDGITLYSSPYDDCFVDVKFSPNFRDKVVFEYKEEFVLWRAALLAVGLFFFIVAPFVCDWVTFYYTSGMAMGIIILLVFTVYQIMKFLPLRPQSSARVVIFGSMLGFGAMIANFMFSYARNTAAYFGLGEDLWRPVMALLIGVLVMIGSAFGFWVVRKFVLSPDGVPDAQTVTFVKWGIRVVASAMVVHGSPDAIIALCFLVTSIVLFVVVPAIPWRWLRRVLLREKRSASGERDAVMGLEEQEEFHDTAEAREDMGDAVTGVRRRQSATRQRRQTLRPHQYEEYSQSQEVEDWTLLPSRQSRRQASPRTPAMGGRARAETGMPFHLSPLLDRAIPSSIHDGPHSRHLRAEEAKAVTKECTQMVMEQLLQSPQFQLWASRNIDRLKILRERDEASEGDMAEDFDESLEDGYVD